MTRTIALKHAVQFFEVGRIPKMHTVRLDRGSESIRVGASEADVAGLLCDDALYARVGYEIISYARVITAK